ncbi:MAG: ABC transporter ATP-binding protein/permease [Spirochaetota bacterium]|nr:ABC transporter ATP-binding protein/permease [Spirochaetota bacterium]
MHPMTPKSSKKIDINIIRKIIKLILPYKKQIFFSVIILLIGRALIVLIPLGIKFGIDIISNIPIKIEFLEYFKIDLSALQLIDIAIVLFFIIVLQFLASYFQINITNYLGQNVMRDLRAKLFAHTMNQSLSFFDKSKVGQLITRIVHDVQTLNELFVTGISTLFGDLFLIICIFLISFLLDYKLAIVSLFTFPFMYLGMLVFKKFARKSFLEIRTKLALMNAFLQATISGMKIIQVFNKQAKMARIFRRIQKDYFIEFLRTVKIYSYYFPGVELFSILSRVLLIMFGSYWVYTGETPLSNVIAFLFYSPMFFQPLKELSEQYNVLQSALASSEKIFSLLETDESIEDPSEPVTNMDFKGNIEFKNVSFAYNRDNDILHNISFKINSGEKVALVGVTGSGKTTIINLINRLYDIDRGEIILDGINIKNIRKSELRNIISSVLQDVFIFSDSIRNNITLFDSSITDKEVKIAAKQVQAHSFIERLNNHYDTELGERGVGISYGEKQLLAFARAFIHKSKIVIFDEATSNIDLQTEAIIQNNIKKLIKNHTAIIVAHRLSTIKEVNKIIVIHKGEIKEIGTHTELLKKNGYYKKLYKLQFQTNSI